MAKSSRSVKGERGGKHARSSKSKESAASTLAQSALPPKPSKLGEASDTGETKRIAGSRPDSLKIRQIGNSLGVVLPKDVLAKLRVGEGDELHMVETPDGLELRPYDPDLERQLEAGRSIAKRYRNALRELAK
jgi:putative addiction module antidote